MLTGLLKHQLGMGLKLWRQYTWLSLKLISVNGGVKKNSLNDRELKQMFLTSPRRSLDNSQLLGECKIQCLHLRLI